MSFESKQSFQKQLSRLLAMIIMFEKKIEQLKKKLSGNEQFHTRLIFQRMDFTKKGEITPEDMIYALTSENHHFGLVSCQALCRKYTVSGAITYEELLAMIIPKNDKALAQRVLIRATKRGATLPNYLWKYFCQLFYMILSMTVLTQQVRKKIQNSTSLNHLQMVQFFKKILRSNEAIWKFCNQNSDQQYDFSIRDTCFLSNHIRSKNPLPEMTDEDIKQLICPLDMNFQKTVQEMAPYYQNIKAEKYKTEHGVFYHQIKAQQQAKKCSKVNFLNTDYRAMYPNTRKLKQNKDVNYQYPLTYYQNTHIVPAEKEFTKQPQQNNMILKPSRVISDSPMYLDNFTKPVEYEKPNREGIELDKYLSDRYQKRGNQYQKFEDDFNDNVDSDNSNNAFQHV